MSGLVCMKTSINLTWFILACIHGILLYIKLQDYLLQYRNAVEISSFFTLGLEPIHIALQYT